MREPLCELPALLGGMYSAVQTPEGGLFGAVSLMSRNDKQNSNVRRGPMLPPWWIPAHAWQDTKILHRCCSAVAGLCVKLFDQEGNSLLDCLRLAQWWVAANRLQMVALIHSVGGAVEDYITEDWQSRMHALLELERQELDKPTTKA